MGPGEKDPSSDGARNSGAPTLQIICEEETPKAKKLGMMRPSYSRTTSAVRQKLRELDVNKDGSLDEDELVKGIEQLVHETQMRKIFMYMAAGLILAVLVLIGAIGGMTYGILQAMKDTQVNGSILVATDTNAPVQTASTDMAVVNGVLVSRQALASNGSSTANITEGVLRAAQFTTQQRISSHINIKALMEMRYFYVSSPKAEVALMVLGVARLEDAGSVHGSVVKIVTLSGTIILDDVMISFEEDVAPIFKQAGFLVDNAGRRLLGVYDIFGFFAFIEDLEVFNLPPNEPKPALPAGDFQMVVKSWEPCLLNYEGEVSNRCQYTPTKPTSINDTQALSRRLLDDTAGNDTLTVPGVETLDDGADYMTSVNTVTKVGTLTRTVYEFAAFPDMLKIEVMDEGRKNVSSWQEPKLGPGVTWGAYWCQQYVLPKSFFDSAGPARNLSGVSFAFVGYATKMGIPARHFALTMPQPPDINGNAQGPLTVDYYDTTDTHYPLFFDFYHPTAGHMLMHVQSFVLLNDTTRPSKASLLPPLKSACLDDSSDIAKMTSAFTPPPASPLPVSDTAGQASNATTTTAGRRALLAIDPETGLPRHTGRSGGPAYIYDPFYDPERPWLSEVYNRSSHALARRRAEEACSTSRKIIPTINLGPCSFGMNYVAPPAGVEFNLDCEGSFTFFPFLIFTGHVDLNTCVGGFNGCLSVALGLDTFNNKVVRVIRDKLGIKNINLLEICGGYNWKDRIGYVKGTYSGPPLWLWIAKAELSGEVRFSECCTWIEYVTVEAFLGIDLGFWSYYSSVGSWDVVSKPKYLRGQASEAQAEMKPTIINAVGSIQPAEGWWGDWSDTSFCYASITGQLGKAQGLAVNGVQLRIERPGGDDTALNAVRMACLDGNSVSPHDGWWGDWGGWQYCPGDQVIVGAQMRVEPRQGGGDDTAGNGLRFLCSNGAWLYPGDGYWGDWYGLVRCPGNSFVCGLQIRIESQQGGGDDTALNGVRLQCCNPV